MAFIDDCYPNTESIDSKAFVLLESSSFDWRILWRGVAN
jgi:hypothetical protein